MLANLDRDLVFYSENEGGGLGVGFVKRCRLRRPQSGVLALGRNTARANMRTAGDAVPPAFQCLKIHFIFYDTRFDDTKKRKARAVPSS